MLAAAFANFVKKALFASAYGFTAASSIMLAMPDTAQPPIHRDNNFDSLRVLAAAMVMLSHSWALVKRADEPIAEITYGSLAGGPLGVWMFFAISGYLVCQSYTVRRNLFAFVEARVLRIYPAFAACILFSLAVGAIATTLPLAEFIRHPQTWDYLTNNLIFELRYSLPGVFVNNPYPNAVNGSIWTLPAETMLYVLVALLGVTTVLARRMWVALMLMALLLVLSIQPATVTYVPYMDSTLYAPAVRCFLLGMLVFVLRDQVRLHGGIVVLLALLIVLTSQHQPPGTLLMCVTVAYTTFWLAFHPRLKLPISGRIGDTSYGLYVYAFPIQQLIAWWLPAIGPWALFASSFACSFVVAWCSWHVIERPALALKGRASGWLATRMRHATDERI